MTIGLFSLSDEGFAMIFNQIHSQAPETVPELCLVSKQFYRLAKPMLFRSLVLTPSKLERLNALKSLREIIILFTRDILIHGAGFEWALLANLLRGLKRLKSIRWRSWKEPFPRLIMDCLEHSPSTVLYIEDLPIGHKTEDVDVQRHDLELLDRLRGCPNICSIKAKINYEHSEPTRRLKEVMMSCTNLEVLHLRIPRTDGRIGWVSDGLGVYDFGVEPGDRLPPLRELVYESRSPPRLVSLIPSSFWDWSRIRHLEIRGQPMVGFVNSIQGQIKYLETLKVENFSGGWGYTYATQVLSGFISAIHGLIDLELVNPTMILPLSIFTQQGTTLKRLCYHRPRHPWVPFAMRSPLPFSPEELDIISSSCPNLTSLSIQMMIDDDLPYNFLSALARIKCVDTLRLYAIFSLSPYCYEHVTHLSTDTLTVRHLAHYLCTHKVGCAFQKIEVMLGDYIETHNPPDEYSRPNILFTCHVKENGDITVQDDSHEVKYTDWAEYLDVDNLSKRRGHTYPPDLQEWNRAGVEADRIMAGCEEAQDEDQMASLFGSFSESDVEGESA